MISTEPLSMHNQHIQSLVAGNFASVSLKGWTCSQRWCRNPETSCCSCAWLPLSFAVTSPAASSASTRALPLSAAAASACKTGGSRGQAPILHKMHRCIGRLRGHMKDRESASMCAMPCAAAAI